MAVTKLGWQSKTSASSGPPILVLRVATPATLALATKSMTSKKLAADAVANGIPSLEHATSRGPWHHRIAPSPAALIFVLLGLAVPLLLQKPLLNSDGDLARHLAHGRYMLEHGSLIRADPFSFTRPGAPFVGFEYGSQLLYALAERAGGLPAVAILAGLLIALTYGLLTQLLLRRGVDPLLTCLTVGMAVALGIEHWTARPHLFTFVAVVLLFGMLERPGASLEHGRWKPGLYAAALFVLWANLHGGFVYGWVLIALYLLGSLGELVWGDDRQMWKLRVRYYMSLLVTAVAVTLVNPRGLELHRHLVAFFHKSFALRNTSEFVSPDFHETSGKVFLGVLLLAFGSLGLNSRRPSLPHFLVICAGIAFALISLRNIPLFGLTALPLLAFSLDSAWRRLPDPTGVRGRFEATVRQTSTLPWILAAIVLLGGLGMTRGRIGSLQVIQDRFDPRVFPIDAVAHARNANLQGHLFSEFTWGGYLVYAWPEQKIFIDGGTDFFGDDVFREYRSIKLLEPGWRSRLAQRDIALALLRPESALAHELAREASWPIWYCDSLAAVFRRTPAPPVISLTAADSAEQALNHCGQ